jgi:hypothetical protein
MWRTLREYTQFHAPLRVNMFAMKETEFSPKRHWLWLAGIFALAIATAAIGPRWSVRAQATPHLSGDDYAEILQLYFKYPITLDSGDAEAYADLFTDDGSFQNNVGRAALIAFVKGRAATTVRHAPLTPIITATPEGAKGTVMNLFIDVAQTPAVITRV